jgi:hypothetical protein
VIRVALFVALVFLFVGMLRVIRLLLQARSSGGRAPSRRRPLEGEMVRDPICGTWIDRRLALSGSAGGEPVPVCSERCRRELEGQTR